MICIPLIAKHLNESSPPPSNPVFLVLNAPLKPEARLKTNQNETTPTDPRLQSRPETSRQNGAKSNGPVSPQGKANSSRNATKHGFLARTIVLPNESPKRFARLLKSLRTQLQPANEVEKDIVDCMAVARWRRLRAWGLERAIIGYESKNRARHSRPPGLTFR